MKDKGKLFSDVYSALVVDNLKNSVAIVELEEIILNSIELKDEDREKLQKSVSSILKRVDRNITLLEQIKDNDKK